MKLSTRIKKSGFLWLNGDCDTTMQTIVLIVDCKLRHRTHSLKEADRLHKDFLANGCRLLLQESPVFNSNNEIIYHYTSTTYKEWCKA